MVFVLLKNTKIKCGLRRGEIVDKAENEVVIIDTAPTGHTLLLLDSTLSYHREVQRTKGETPISVQRLLPRLRDEKHTEVVIVTLPEATPVFEAMRLREDLSRGGINNKWWAVNQSLSAADVSNPMLSARAAAETAWIDKVQQIVMAPWLFPGYKIPPSRTLATLKIRSKAL